MGFVGDMFSSGKGAGFQASGPNADQVGEGYTNTQDAIAQQRAFVQQLAAQNGLANQNHVFQQQQGLEQQLQGVANGTGPNPALAQLHQATAANTANQAAIMAGQRGASANTGLIARQAAMQGAANQQNSIGQAATLQAQQQLAGMQQLQQQQASMGNLANTQVNQQQSGQTALNNATLQQQANLYGIQGNMNSANAGIAGGNQAAQGNMMGNMMGGIGSLGNMFGGSSSGGGLASSGGEDMAGGAGDAIGSGGEMVAAKGGMVPQRKADGGNIDDGNPLTGSTNAKAMEVAAPATAAVTGPQSNVVKTMNIDSNMKAAPKSSGGGGNPMSGMSGMAGGAMSSLMNIGKSKAMSGAMNYIGDFFSGMGEGVGGLATTVGAGAGGMAGGAGDAIGSAETGTAVAGMGTMAGETAAVAAKGGKVPLLLSPGEKYLSKDQAKQVAEGKANPMAAGKTVPGKPKVGGANNSYANDFVRASGKPGDVVIPRSVTQSKDAAKKAEAFVKAVLAQKGTLPMKKA